jgi:4-aminobutyrate aminotransferase
MCERLGALVQRIGPNGHHWQTFLTNSGTEAVEASIKLARHHTGRPGLIAFRGGFHGRTLGSLSLTASKSKYRRRFGPLLPNVFHARYGDAASVEELFTTVAAPDDVAAIVVEPVLGEGGYIVPPADFLPRLREIADKHGILLVFDEIQSGIGRTGRMFAAEHFGVEPDILLSAKGLASGMPLGAIIARESIMTWTAGSHGSTFGGNPVCCAAALATLDVVQDGLIDNARVMGERLIAGARALMARNEHVGDVRGLGLMIGLEMVNDRASREPAPEIVRRVELAAFARGLLVLSCGRSTIRMAPPLTIDSVDVDTGLRILGEVLDDVAAD